ncbi:MAG: diaminopropionate ammonia-lyase [Lachnospirales bacterium]
MGKIKWQKNNMPKTDPAKAIEFLSEGELKKVKQFHESFPAYEETPLANLSELAKKIGLKSLHVKDESYRFGLNAFKVLGGSYAMGSYIAQKLNVPLTELPFDKLTSKEVKDKLGDITFYTATDGNHGRGVAWAARELNQKSVVYMPKGSSQTRLKNIQNEGAEASITDLNYDDAVRLANDDAEKSGNGVMVQDTAWEGYTDIPAWIMQGYATMAFEAMEQLEKEDIKRPTHVFVQAGVGSLAGAVQGYFSAKFKENPPTVVVVEADLADCLYKSAVRGDGEMEFVGGDMQTIMAGLACGEPNIIGFDVLKNHTHTFVSSPDWVSAKAMRILGNPLKGDDRVTSGESGAVTLGIVYEVMTNPEYKELKETLGLDENSEVLLFSTEGDTDPDKYREICWEGTF